MFRRALTPIVFVLVTALTPVLVAGEVRLTLTSEATCSTPVGATVTVALEMTDPPCPVVGGQYFLRYDTSVLAFQGASPGDLAMEFWESVDQYAGRIGYASVVDSS